MSQVRFICSKCGRPHSIEEYEKSRFCVHCGTYLSLQGREEGAATPNSLERNASIFPYASYPQQVEFMKDISEVVGGGGVLIAEACNGFGKTVCALSRVLEMGKGIVYATRTHEQARQVLHEVEVINGKSGRSFSA